LYAPLCKGWRTAPKGWLATVVWLSLGVEVAAGLEGICRIKTRSRGGQVILAIRIDAWFRDAAGQVDKVPGRQAFLQLSGWGS